MTIKKSLMDAKPDGELLVTRVFDAPRDLVWKVWTDPAHLRSWWGPKNFTLPHCNLDMRAGGAYRFVMRAPDGADHAFGGEYEEVKPPERLVFLGELDNVPEDHVVRTTVTFEEDDGKTKITVRQAYFGFQPTGANEGWSQSLDRLAEYLAKV